MENIFSLEKCGKIQYLQCLSNVFSQFTVHAFSTRYGGASKNPYANLNLSLNVGDSDHSVLENRRRFLNTFDIDYQKVICVEQVHGDHIAVIKKKDSGKGALSFDSCIPGKDAMITNIPNIPLSMFYADCVPVFLLDPIKKAIGLIHAGRNGTFFKITLKTLFKMKEIYGTRPKDCLAIIFPSIGACCYQFKNHEIIRDWLTDKNIKNEIVQIKKNITVKIDLKKANMIQLKEAGIKSKNIFLSKNCTFDRSDIYFSHRRDNGKTGRMAAFLILKDSH